MTWVYGTNPVLDLLDAAPSTILEIRLQRSDRPSPLREKIEARAAAAGIRCERVDAASLRAAVGDAVHQGVIARTEAFRYADERSLLGGEGDRLLIVLDQVQDPRNLGAISRSALAFGAAGLVIPRHGSAEVTAASIKASAGAVLRLPVARVTNVTRFIEASREAGFWAFGAAAGTGVSAEAADWAPRSLIVVGAEGDGLRQGVRAACDRLVSIPVAGVESLNVSVAAGILAWEWRMRSSRLGAPRPGR
jgi:23S rRNA (guanosine2251-2'-O)-methyltransferase